MQIFLNGHTIVLKKYLWRIKVPLKIKIFMWFIYKKLFLTKDNLSKRRLVISLMELRRKLKLKFAWKFVL
jgi:hypothetical protein